ncbi:MAG: Npt1/Npt2 family nucleotide transporter [Myxococcota bacterium]
MSDDSTAPDSGAEVQREPSALDRALRLFSDVEAGEGKLALLMVANLFVIMLCYYVIKTVREPLVQTSGGGEFTGGQLKTYAAGAQALVLMVAVPTYARLVSAVETSRLIRYVTLFFAANIAVFYALAQLGAPGLGFVFYVWVGIFSLATIAQFWSYANDVYDKPTGERIFPIVALGATAGAAAGSFLARTLFRSGFGAFNMLLLAGALLLTTLVFYGASDRQRRAAPASAGRASSDAPKVEAGAGFDLVFKNRYILLIALLLILLNLVNTVGEYVLAELVGRAASEAVAAGSVEEVGDYIGAFYGEFFTVVNIAGVILQAFVASRLVKYFGIAGVLFLLPLVSLGTYAFAAVGVPFALFRWLKTAENSTDYSVMNTAKAMLWLPTSRAEKFAAKQAVDTFFVRLGDVFAAILVFVGTSFLDLGLTGFAAVNVVVVVVWLGVAWALRRRYQALQPAS